MFIIAQAASPSSKRLTFRDEPQNTTLLAVSFQIRIYLSHSRKVLNTAIVAKVSFVFTFFIFKTKCINYQIDTNRLCHRKAKNSMPFDPVQ